MTAARHPRRPARRRTRLAVRWAALAAVLAAPAFASAQVGGRFDGSGRSWRDDPRLSPVGRRMAAAKLAQRERDAARRRNRYAFGRNPDGGVPGAALAGPRVGPPIGDAPAPDTAVRVEIVADGVRGMLAARQWTAAFAALGVPVRIGSAGPRDVLGVTEVTRAGLRTVTATGQLTAGGDLSFGEATFAPADRAELGRWVADLRTHGAAGGPAGKPLWGLSEPAFAAVLAALKEPAPAGFAAAGGGTVGAAVSALELPASLPIAVTPEAEAALAAPGAARRDSRFVGGELPALSKGTALAVALARRGLAFRPNRRPDGTVELLVVPRPAGDAAVPAPDAAPAAREEANPAAPPEVWPVGWELAGGADRGRAARTLFALSDIGLPPAPLPAFAAAASGAAGVPVVLDAAALAAAGADPAAVFAVPPGRGTWATALRYALAEHRLVGELRRDEAGAAFLWVVPARR